MNSLAYSFIKKVLASVKNTINGPAPEDIQVHDERFYWRVFLFGSLGLGNGAWKIVTAREMIDNERRLYRKSIGGK